MRARRALAATVDQAQALMQGRLVTRPEPPQAELMALTRGMNAMVARVKAAFDVQAGELERLRHRAQCDGLTGLSNRGQFLAQLEATLQREDGAEQCGLVLLRLRDLDGVNRALGRAATDRILGAIAQALRPYGDRVPGCMQGRLNGADFALCLPVGGVARRDGAGARGCAASGASRDRAGHRGGARRRRAAPRNAAGRMRWRRPTKPWPAPKRGVPTRWS